MLIPIIALAYSTLRIFREGGGCWVTLLYGYEPHAIKGKGKFLGGLRSNVHIHGIFYTFDECSWNTNLLYSQNKLVMAPLSFIPTLLSYFFVRVVL